MKIGCRVKTLQINKYIIFLISKYLISRYTFAMETFNYCKKSFHIFLLSFELPLLFVLRILEKIVIICCNKS